MTTKELIVVGGPNGAGKTTFADKYVARHGCNYVGADAIAAQLSPDDPTNAQMAASREFLRQIDVAIAGSDELLIRNENSVIFSPRLAELKPNASIYFRFGLIMCICRLAVRNAQAESHRLGVAFLVILVLKNRKKGARGI